MLDSSSFFWKFSSRERAAQKNDENWLGLSLKEILLGTFVVWFFLADLSCNLRFFSRSLSFEIQLFGAMVMEKRLSFAFVGESVVEAPLPGGGGDLLHLRFRNQFEICYLSSSSSVALPPDCWEWSWHWKWLDLHSWETSPPPPAHCTMATFLMIIPLYSNYSPVSRV